MLINSIPSSVGFGGSVTDWAMPAVLATLDLAPTFRDDAVQASVGWPLVELTLQTGNAPSGDRAWCRVVEFAEEFGISVSYDPLVLGERRGG